MYEYVVGIETRFMLRESLRCDPRSAACLTTALASYHISYDCTHQCTFMDSQPKVLPVWSDETEVLVICVLISNVSRCELPFYTPCSSCLFT